MVASSHTKTNHPRPKFFRERRPYGGQLDRLLQEQGIDPAEFELEEEKQAESQSGHIG